VDRQPRQRGCPGYSRGTSSAGSGLIYQALDADQPLPDCSPASISHTLVYILAALPEPLVPIYLQTKCLGAGDRDEGYALLEGVEGVHTNVRI
jgi:hypothetical protein